ncbi:hypothetical protein [Pinisolibacter sp.]|uniref:hypothetical protein n=1 Tax=Pinisolibacter sp. TaxID=2172024 RepID=UPI002FDD49B3
MSRLVVPCVLEAGATVAVAAEKPSFDCGTAKAAREKVVCRDARLAASDRAMAAAHRADLSRAPVPSVPAE